MIEVLKPGVFSSLQDSGRYDFQSLGVAVCGVMDSSALRLANLLVGNPSNTAVIEMTLHGARLKFHKQAIIALSGANFSPQLDEQAITNHRPYLVKAGQILDFKPTGPQGARSYLAVGGGFDLPLQMGSLSTDIKNKIGGLQGRALQKEDRLKLAKKIKKSASTNLKARLEQLPIYLPVGLGNQPRTHLRALKGAHWDCFTKESQTIFTQQSFKLSADSDRMGFRLLSDTLKLQEPLQILSEGATFGTIQVPADGQAIVLMADRQTIGGYPKIANICTVDLPVLAQYLPHQEFKFQLITLEEAQALLYQREQAFKTLENNLKEQINYGDIYDNA